MADTEGVYKQIAEQVSFEEDDDFEEFETQGRSRAPPDFGDRALPPRSPRRDPFVPWKKKGKEEEGTRTLTSQTTLLSFRRVERGRGGSRGSGAVGGRLG